jgi:S1-C subfamily serine protease
MKIRRRLDRCIARLLGRGAARVRRLALAVNLLLVVACAVSAACAIARVTALSSPSIAYRAGASALVSVFVDLGGEPAMGSGVVVEGASFGLGQVALTAAHVVHGTHFAVVSTTEDGVEHSRTIAIVLYRDEVADLAVLRLAEDLPVHPIRVARNEPATYDTLYAIANPDGAPRTVGPAILSARHRRGVNGAEVWQLTAFSWPGSSGGPVVNAAGELVAVIVAVDVVDDPTRDDEGARVLVPCVTFAAPLAAVHAVLAGAAAPAKDGGA